MTSFKTTLALAAVLTLGGVAAVAAANDEQIKAEAGKVVFDHKCHVCHDAKKTSTYGPSLVGVYGRKAGTLPNYAYSDAMKAAGFVWTEETLRAWMANNTGVVPGTRMRHVGVTDPAEQDFIIAYLRALKK
ncbi:MAG: c-type cytochrome [Hyphomicrobiaceae bacterium]|nr:c-type cytochrome [Hyphomicrobiaceae bacterium]